VALTNDQQLYLPTSLTDAMAALVERGAEGAALAGATWVMRAALRNETARSAYVAVSTLEELQHVHVDANQIDIGACVTHAQLVASIAHLAEYKALATAARSAANPAVREVATVGGNLCASGFVASDLVPALLCLDATVDLQTPRGSEQLPLDRFLALRDEFAPGWLVLRIRVPRHDGHSAHIRLPLRVAGDYPVAILSLALRLAPAGHVIDARVVVGSVERTARRWTRLEAGIIGQPLDAPALVDMASAYSSDFEGRDGVEASGPYRVKVLPRLALRAIESIRTRSE